MGEGNLRIELDGLFGIRNARGRIDFILCRRDLQARIDVARIVLNLFLEFSHRSGHVVALG